MMSGPRLVATGLLVALQLLVPLGAQQPQPGAVQRPATATSIDGWYRVSWHGTDPARSARCARHCAVRLHGLGGRIAQLLSLDPEQCAPKQPLDVHVYERLADWAAVEQRLTKGRFSGNQAFSHHETKTSHVALQPIVAPILLDERGPPVATLSVLAHEAAHVAVYGLSPGFRFHPSWLAEGIALHAARTPTGRGRPIAIRSRYDPDLGTVLARVRRLLGAGRLPRVRDVLAGSFPGLDFYERYAVQEWWFAFLVEHHAAALRTVLTRLTSLPARPNYGVRVERALIQSLGPAWKRIDHDFREFCGQGHPAWEQTYRMLDSSSVPMLQVAFDHNALAWRHQPSPTGAYAVEIAGQIRPGRGRQMNVLLERANDGFVSIATVAGHGVTVLRYHARTNTWQRLAHWNRPGWIAVDRLFEWRALVDAPRSMDQGATRGLRIVVGDRSVIETTIPASVRAPQCGLGVQAGTAAEWVRFEVVPR